MNRTFLTIALCAAGLMPVRGADIKGDIDGDGKLTMDDAHALADVILGNATTAAATDINGDGATNIADVAKLIDMVLNKKDGGIDVGIGDWEDSDEDYGGTVSAPPRRAATTDAGTIAITAGDLHITPGGTADISVAMDNSVDINGFQISLALPEGLELAGAKLTRAADSHLLKLGTTASGKTTLLSYSTDNAAYPSSGELLCLTIRAKKGTGNFAISLANAVASTASFAALYAGDIDLAASVVWRRKLAAGWQWTTFNIDGIDTRDDLLAAFDDTGRINRITGIVSEIVNDSKFGLVGNLAAIDHTAMYKVQMTGPATVSYEAAAQDTEVALQRGWNWLGYLPDTDMPLAEALAGLDAATGDKIVGFDFNADYTEGVGWKGGLDIMEAGQGYMYYSSTAKTFSYPTPAAAQAQARRVASAEDNSGEWTVNTHQYPNRLPIVAQLMCGGDNVGESYTVGAFCNGECRGIGKLVDGRIYINVCGDKAADIISFVARNADSGEQQDVNETVPFGSDALGSYTQPFILTLGPASGVATHPGDKPAHSCHTITGIRLNPDAPGSSAAKGMYIIDGKKVWK